MLNHGETVANADALPVDGPADAWSEVGSSSTAHRTLLKYSCQALFCRPPVIRTVFRPTDPMGRQVARDRRNARAASTHVHPTVTTSLTGSVAVGPRHLR